MHSTDGVLIGLRPLIRLVLVLVAVISAIAAQSVTPGPPVPFEEPGACPFEGCVYRDWVANAAVTVKTDRRADAPALFTVVKGEWVRAITGVVVTNSPGRVQFREAIDLQTTAGKVHVEPGQTLYLLTYRGEGWTAAWFNGRQYDQLDGSEFFNASCERMPGSCNGTIIEAPQRVWWIQLQNKSGQTGWTDQSAKFDNKDAFG